MDDIPNTEPPDPETLARLERALAAMPRMTRDILLAHRLDNKSYAEIARITGLSIRQVEKHMASAIYQIARHMGGDQPARWQHFRARIARWFC